MLRTFLWILPTLATCLLAQCRSDVTTVYVVRHAEKARDQGKDPALTAVGRARAQALARVLDGVDIDEIYATEYKRTVQTVQPVADARSVEVHILPPGDTKAIANRARGAPRGKHILVAGHYNTVPDLLRALGVDEEIDIGHDDHGDLFVVTIGTDGAASLEHRRFDP